MARQAHIVSFADAQKQSRPGRIDAASSRQTGRARRATFETGSASRVRGRSARAVRRDEEEAREQEFLDQLERRRRNRAKARADKMFSQQFEDVDFATQAEGTPRPALYEGKMGSSHRKSARMQRSSLAGSPSAKVNSAGWFSGVKVSARAMRAFTVIACVALTCLFLYVPAKQYYQAEREHDRLAAEYAVIEQRNDVLDAQNDALASDAGMEDAVREKYGYVKSGEQTAIVTGLSDSATDASRDGERIEANILSSSVKAPEEWYTPLLDAFFGVE